MKREENRRKKYLLKRGFLVAFLITFFFLSLSLNLFSVLHRKKASEIRRTILEEDRNQEEQIELLEAEIEKMIQEDEIEESERPSIISTGSWIEKKLSEEEFPVLIGRKTLDRDRENFQKEIEMFKLEKREEEKEYRKGRIDSIKKEIKELEQFSHSKALEIKEKLAANHLEAKFSVKGPNFLLLRNLISIFQLQRRIQKK